MKTAKQAKRVIHERQPLPFGEVAKRVLPPFAQRVFVVNHTHSHTVVYFLRTAIFRKFAKFVSPQIHISKFRKLK
jgi:hypothetical protein